MKKLVILIAAAGCLFVSCPAEGGNTEEQPYNPPVNPNGKTTVIFDNTKGISGVSVYDYYQRRDSDLITYVPAGRLSNEIEYTSGDSVPFFFSYAVNLKDVSDFTLNFVPKDMGKNQKIERIDAGKINTVIIPKFDEVVSSRDELLSENSYLLIQNNSSFSFQLQRGTNLIFPDNASASRVNSGERARYTITPAPASDYSLLVGADNKPFPVASFEAGRVYSFVYENAVSQVKAVAINLENIAVVSQSRPVPETPGAPNVSASDRLLTINWAEVNGAEYYNIYYGTSQQPPSSPSKTVSGTAALLSGLTNKTVYYVWIKAVNSAGSSALSPYGRGVPWSTVEKPAAPSRLAITPGINQLTVNWDESGGAASYEIYVGTSPTTRPSAPTTTSEKNSAVINNLQSNVTYYIWVRAVNSAGQSDFSAPEAGATQIPTVAPAAPAMPLVTAGSRTISVSWQQVQLASAYEVWVGTTGNPTQAQKRGEDITGGVTETVITGLVNETTYYIWIKAKNNVGTSDFSPPASAKPSASAVAPDAPLAPTVSADDKELSLSWPLVEGALTYEVWYGQSDNQGNAQKYGDDVSGTTVTLTDLVNETTYYIWIKAKNSIGTSRVSPAATGMPSAYAKIPPLAPQTAPDVIAGSGQLTINWQKVEGAAVYEVWAGTSPNPTIAAKRGDDIVGLSTEISGLTNETTYYVWIKAKNGIGASDFSPMASGTPSVYAVPPQAPARPTLSLGDKQLIAEWAAVEGATAYEVWMGRNSDYSTATKYGADITASLSVTISGLDNGTVYYAWVKAKNNSGTSGFSMIASGKPIGTPTTPVLTSGFRQLQVTWTAVTGADEYQVYYGTTEPPAAFITAATTTTAITGLTNGTSYYVSIRAKNAYGFSDYSPTASEAPSERTPGLYRGNEKLGEYNLTTAITYISAIAADKDEFYYVMETHENSAPITLTFTGKNVGITLLGYGGERVISLNANGSLFTLNSGATLTLDENITLNGRSNNASLVAINSGGKLIMNDGAKIIGNTRGYSAGGGVFVGGGTFIMDGGEISGNSAYDIGGGGVYIGSGTFTMNNGKISNNSNGCNNNAAAGGGVCVGGGTFTMNGGEISGNTASGYRSKYYYHAYGGGVYISGGTFTMNGGGISGNIVTSTALSAHGGGVFVGGGTFTMKGGEISGNTASDSNSTASGGGVYVDSGTFSKTGGIITGYAMQANDNLVKDSAGVILNERGHAVYVGSSPAKRREITAGPTVNLDSFVSGALGGWQ